MSNCGGVFRVITALGCCFGHEVGEGNRTGSMIEVIERLWSVCGHVGWW